MPAEGITQTYELTQMDVLVICYALGSISTPKVENGKLVMTLFGEQALRPAKKVRSVMSAKAISKGEFKRLKRLLKIAHGESASLRRTMELIADTLPQERTLSLENAVNSVVDQDLPARELLRLVDVRVKR